MTDVVQGDCPKSQRITLTLCKSAAYCKFQKLASIGDQVEIIQVCTRNGENPRDICDLLIEIFKKAEEIRDERPELKVTYCLQLATEKLMAPAPEEP